MLGERAISMSPEFSNRLRIRCFDCSFQSAPIRHSECSTTHRRLRAPTVRAAPEEAVPGPLHGPLHGPHSLAWPSASHRVVQGFGEHRNPELGTITMNLGIDIAEPKGSAVTAAADGIASIVSTLPSYGTIV